MKAASVKTIIYMNFLAPYAIPVFRRVYYIVGEMMHKPNCTTCTYLQSTEVSKQIFFTASTIVGRSSFLQIYTCLTSISYINN